MKKPEENQMRRELLGVTGLNFMPGTVSGGRLQMWGSHIGQALVIKGSTERYIQTGMEREYGKYTFSIKVPGESKEKDGIQVIRIIERYPKKSGLDAIKHNPQTIIIYEDLRTKEIGMINLPNYCSNHPYFGFDYKATDALREVRVGSHLPAETILLDSPSITKNGGYKYGTQLNIAYMTHPAVSEDGIVISRDVLEKLSFNTYETRVVEWGKQKFALNLYGTRDNYKAFPDIGDHIRSDGLLMALRTYDKGLAVIEQSINDSMEPDMIFDKLIYAGGAGGKVVDIRIQRNNQIQTSISAEMDSQAEKYDDATKQFYSDILNEYHRLRRERQDELRVTPEFHRLCVEAMAMADPNSQKITKLHRRAPIDDYRIEFVIEHHITPTIGFKATDCVGGKGVICKVVEPHEMPVDENGNRADILMDPNSTVARMNIGRLYEQYFNAASRDVVLKICSMVGFSKGEKQLANKLAQLDVGGSESINRAWEYLMGYYSIISPKLHFWFTGGAYKNKRTDHLASIIEEGIYLYIPPDNSPELDEVVSEIEAHYRPIYGPVSYIGNSGKRVTTANNIRIGSIYIILLEKTGDDWTAVSSGKLQHFGILSQVISSDKYSQPNRVQAIRALGEAEVRIYISYAGAEITADIMDRNNNPNTHKAILSSLLENEEPTNIFTAVDRKKNPLGGSKPIGLVQHIGVCSGWRFVYKKHVPNYKPLGC